MKLKRLKSKLNPDYRWRIRESCVVVGVTSALAKVTDRSMRLIAKLPQYTAGRWQSNFDSLPSPILTSGMDVAKMILKFKRYSDLNTVDF